jgi:diguanylate cyclase (GGDEF)-like protein/PAS domain S-box-containing protein
LINSESFLNDKHDLSEYNKPDIYLNDIELRYLALYNSSFYCILIHDIHGKFLDANKATLNLLGYTKEELRKLNLKSFFPDEQIKIAINFIELLNNNDTIKSPFEFRLKNKNGEFIWVETEASIIYKKGSPYAIQWIARDITHKKNMIEHLHTLSLIDELTGLYNRRGFINLAEQHLRLAKRLKKDMLIIFTDVDNLKSINDNFGHKEGDKVLIGTANILRKTFRESDILARIGGDEFVVITIDTTYRTAEAVTQRLNENLNEYNKIKNPPYNFSLSTGISVHNSKTVYSVQDLLDSADKHMYHQKRTRQHRLPVFSSQSRISKKLLSESFI